jgi:hypothetical protein
MAAAATPSLRTAPAAIQRDDGITVCAIAALAFMLSDVLHEGLGHACTALLTIAPAGVISTVAWSSAYDSKLIDAAGTLVNLAAAAVFWLLLKALSSASAQTRLFLLLCCAFNLLTGTGYFFFSGVTNFGDWAGVIYGLHPYLAWRIGLIVVGILTYWASVIAIGSGVVRYLGVPLTERTRYWKLALTSYLSAIVISTLGGLMNPAGLKYVLLSSLPATAGAGCGLLWMRYCVSTSTAPIGSSEPVNRSRVWIAASAIVSLFFVFVLGRGIPLHR